MQPKYDLEPGDAVEFGTLSDELPELPEPDNPILPAWFRPYAEYFSSITATQTPDEKQEEKDIERAEQEIINDYSVASFEAPIPNVNGDVSE